MRPKAIFVAIKTLTQQDMHTWKADEKPHSFS
jgi:hypothetical protein